MKKLVALTLSLMLFATLTLSVPVVFAGFNNANGENGYDGTNKYSSQLPDQSNVPPPAGLVEDDLGPPNTPHVVEGCRAAGGNVPIYEPGIGVVVSGGPCCKGPIIEEGPYAGNYEPNQCCNPPDLLYPQDLYTPGNHCLCFVMRFDPWPPVF